MIGKRSLLILPLSCLILAALIIGLAVSMQPKVSASETIVPHITPAGQRVIATLPFLPRGPEPETTEITPPTETAPTPAPPVVKPTTPVKKVATSQSTPKTVAPKTAAPTTPSCSGGFTTQFVCLLNQYRSSKGLSKLSYNSSLASVALTYSTWMNQTGTFSHTGENGTRFTDRCAAAGVKCYGENLAQGARSAQNLLDMWKASASHNANLLRDGYTAIGLGTSGSYTTALFQ
jgi:uncharacterized protein YkwD